MTLNIEKKYDENENVFNIKLIGDLDISESNLFEETILKAIEESKPNIVVDGEKLDYIDSTGLGIFIKAVNETNKIKKTITIKNLKPNIKKLFLLTDLDKVFQIEG